MYADRPINAWRAKACIPLLAFLAVLLATVPVEAAPASPSSQGMHLAMAAVGYFGSPDAPVEQPAVAGRTIWEVPAPKAGRLRVRECDRLGPSRLHLPPPSA